MQKKTKTMQSPYLTSRITVKESGQMTSFAHESRRNNIQELNLKRGTEQYHLEMGAVKTS